MDAIFKPENQGDYTELDLHQINLLLSGWSGICECDSSTYMPAKDEAGDWYLYCGHCHAVMVAFSPVTWTIENKSRSGELLRDAMPSKYSGDLNWDILRNEWSTNSLDFANWCVDSGFSTKSHTSHEARNKGIAAPNAAEYVKNKFW